MPRTAPSIALLIALIALFALFAPRVALGGPALSDADADAAAAAEAEVITITGKAPTSEGAVRLDAAEARRAPGALGEPLRALALLPGVATGVAALGYPVIRGSLPGESRFSFDGIEMPMLYHFLVGNQVVHPGFLGDLELRASGYGAEHGRLLGGLVSIEAAPEPERPRTELRSTILEVGALHARPLSKRTSIVAAARAGTLSVVAKLVDSRSSLTYVDQQLRVVHRLSSRDKLVVTSLGAMDYMKLPPEEAVYLGFHRLDVRWEHKRAGLRARVGAQTEADLFGFRDDAEPDFDIDGDGATDPGTGTTEGFNGMIGLGARPYAEVAVDPAAWLTVRGGADARYRRLRARGESLFEPERRYLAPARSTEAAGAWVAADMRAGRLTVSPSVRADTYRADHPVASRRHNTVDPRLVVSYRLGADARLEAGGGVYSAPPQVTMGESGVVLGPLPSTDGIGAPAGMSRAYQAQAGVRGKLPGDLDGSLFAYGRDTRYALDFAMVDKDFSQGERSPCVFDDGVPSRYHDTDVDTRAVGVEVMLRRNLNRRLSGWASYSLGRIERDVPMVGRQPHDFDQRHTLNAALQLTAGKWVLGTAFHLHTGRPAVYPTVQMCTLDPGTNSIGGMVTVTDPRNLRRLPTTWRTDLRAERRYQFKSWTGRLVLELQNAALRPEVVGYTTDSQDRVVAEKVLVPVPMIGFEADW